MNKSVHRCKIDSSATQVLKIILLALGTWYRYQTHTHTQKKGTYIQRTIVNVLLVLMLLLI